jgi:formylglycine-generating enzyme required for sulfatase activity
MQTKGKQPETIGHRVFISYYKGKGESSKDRNVADKIYSALNSKGIRCWMAPRDVLPGDEDVKAMIDAVMHSKVLVLIFSLNADKSHWVKSEVRKALDEKITIIPFCIENGFDQSILGFMVGSRHRINAHTQPRRKHLDKLVEAVSEHIKKEPERPLTVVEKRPEAVKVDATKEVKKKAQKKWILLAASIIVLVAIAYFFRYQLGIVPDEKPLVRKTDDGIKKEEPVKKSQLDQTKKKPVTKPEDTIQEKVEEMPEDVRVVKSKGIKVEENKKGFWEAYYRDGIIMVYIPPGEFTMGSDDSDISAAADEKPPHIVDLDGYWMGKYEVTFDQYDKYCVETGQEKPDDGGWGRGKRPVINVSWHNADAYCDWLSKKIGLKFKLPTEAQWEKAAQGTGGRKYPWGIQKPDEFLANFGGHLGKTFIVGSYPQGESPYGILDMAGNVWEWCNDWYKKDYYKNSSDKNPQGPEGGTGRVLRGGHWYSFADSIRCADRNFFDPSARSYCVGFRLC